jgi:DNA-binding CsgD family transcriptional regulator
MNMTTHNVKQELYKDMKKLRNKNQTEILEKTVPLIKQNTQWKATPAYWNK